MNPLAQALQEQFAEKIQTLTVVGDEVTIEIAVDAVQTVCFQLRDVLHFDVLIDLCGVDYQKYGQAEWATESTTTTGFSRGVESTETDVTWNKPRFAVVYHLLSTQRNERLRVRTFCDEQAPLVESVMDVWEAANWFEREAYDLYGILFKGHPDLRRILTDYGFIGHPFRKDFPVSGTVEMRYDATAERVIYEPVEIEPRVLVPKVIREDNRYQQPQEKRGD